MAEGVYTPGSAGNRSATFQLKNGVSVYGGFDGTVIATQGCLVEMRREGERDAQQSGGVVVGDERPPHY